MDKKKLKTIKEINISKKDLLNFWEIKDASQRDFQPEERDQMPMFLCVDMDFEEISDYCSKKDLKKDALDKIKVYEMVMRHYNYSFWDFGQEPRPDIDNLDFFYHWLEARKNYNYISYFVEFFHISLKELEKVIPKWNLQ